MIIPEISPERAMQPASPFQGFCFYRSGSRGLRPGLCCWTLSGSQLQSYSSAIRFISPFSHYIMRDLIINAPTSTKVTAMRQPLKRSVLLSFLVLTVSRMRFLPSPLFGLHVRSFARRRLADRRRSPNQRMRLLLWRIRLCACPRRSGFIRARIRRAIRRPV